MHLACRTLLVPVLLMIAGAVHASCPGPVPTAPADGAVCRVVPGAGPGVLLQGTVLRREGPLDNGQVLIGGDGLIACVACDCSGAAGAATATRVECPDGAISPGLIDAINRLTFAQNPPYVAPDPSVRYAHRHEWRLGAPGLPQIGAAGGASASQVTWAELRSVMAGVTASISSGQATGFFRNLATTADATAIGEQAVDISTFPLGDSNGVTRSSGCNYPNIDDPAVARRRSHVIAEGLDCRARNEFLCLSGQHVDGVDAIPDSSVEHGVGLTTADLLRLRDVGGSLTWQPRTDVSVYGSPAPVLEALNLGLPVALGSNWTRTGSMHLGRELACARSLDAVQFGGRIGDRVLWEMATAHGAFAAGMPDRLGTLAPGALGDVLVVRRGGGDGYTAVVSAQASQIALVLRGGVPLFGEDAVLAAMGAGAPGCEAIDVCGSARRVCVGRETAGAHTVASLQAAVGAGTPPLFFCDTPPNEPTCTPARVQPVAYSGVPSNGDADGDAVPDAQDNCPNAFNPLRRVDVPGSCPSDPAFGATDVPQPDLDQDGIGDACDRCPQDAGEPCVAMDVFADGFEGTP